MSSSPATGPSAELIRYAHGSTRIVRTCRPCVTPVLLTTRGSAHRPRSIGCPACMNGNYSSSPEEESATGRPDRDPLATQDDPAKFFTQDIPGTSANRSWALRAGPTGHLRKHPQARLWPRRGSATRAARPITDEGVAVGGAFDSDTATGLMPIAHRVAGVRSFP